MRAECSRSPFSIELWGCRNLAPKSMSGSAGILPALAGMLPASIARTLPSFRTLVSCSTSMDRTEAEKNVAQLRDEIRKHDRLYYQDAAPIISDREYRPALQESC